MYFISKDDKSERLSFGKTTSLCFRCLKQAHNAVDFCMDLEEIMVIAYHLQRRKSPEDLIVEQHLDFNIIKTTAGKTVKVGLH
ncbi:hypothetical protein T4B_11256 [Trichinella pseudospiralis]|uniref:Uncharacterized protein n=1 Tax=Trichinella pseudospiralis TaxID=6337 RepID=A0A0V1J0C7_TRIPS|nr:hypothetical protein T4B_11256 [Trichinella pseudospiralis]